MDGPQRHSAMLRRGVLYRLYVIFVWTNKTSSIASLKWSKKSLINSYLCRMKLNIACFSNGDAVFDETKPFVDDCVVDWVQIRPDSQRASNAADAGLMGINDVIVSFPSMLFFKKELPSFHCVGNVIMSSDIWCR